tara:strand:- start:678 stop:1487 length:810 start_codon:yes stop_codon:yes gene_type:complete
MSVKIKIMVKNFLGEKIYNFIKFKIKNTINFLNFKKQFYDLKKDYEYNETTLLNIFGNFNKENINQLLKKNNLEYNDNQISWHYHLFASFENSANNILEIGTLDGEFTKYLSNIFPESKIYTIDLNQNDETFKNTYDRNSKEKLNKFLQIRKENLKNENIIFKEIDSFNLMSEFKDIKFDIIWIDGDHLNPQVTLDIFSAYYLVKQNGLIICDDIIQNNYKTEYVNNDSFKTLNFFQKKNLFSNNYIIKRVNKENYKVKKFISISKKLI